MGHAEMEFLASCLRLPDNLLESVMNFWYTMGYGKTTVSQ
jgi:hypothetical protein